MDWWPPTHDGHCILAWELWHWNIFFLQHPAIIAGLFAASHLIVGSDDPLFQELFQMPRGWSVWDIKQLLLSTISRDKVGLDNHRRKDLEEKCFGHDGLLDSHNRWTFDLQWTEVLHEADNCLPFFSLILDHYESDRYSSKIGRHLRQHKCWCDGITF